MSKSDLQLLSYGQFSLKVKGWVQVSPEFNHFTIMQVPTKLLQFLLSSFSVFAWTDGHSEIIRITVMVSLAVYVSVNGFFGIFVEHFLPRNVSMMWLCTCWQTNYVFGCSVFWVALVLVPVITLMRDFVWKLWVDFKVSWLCMQLVRCSWYDNELLDGCVLCLCPLCSRLIVF